MNLIIFILKGVFLKDMNEWKYENTIKYGMAKLENIFKDYEKIINVDEILEKLKANKEESSTSAYQCGSQTSEEIVKWSKQLLNQTNDASFYQTLFNLFPGKLN